MYYQDTQARSLELLRLAIPLMSRQKAPVTPISFAVWYVHAAGHSASLSAEIAELTKDGAVLDEAQTNSLFEKHILREGLPQQGKAADALRDLMSRLTRDVSESSLSTERYAKTLDDLMSQSLSPAPESALAGDPMVAVLAEETRRMRSSLERFESTLTENQKEIETLRVELKRARSEVTLDALSGLVNRRGFDAALEAAISNARSSGSPLWLLMADIDHFKRINDNFGHLTGDRVIRGISTIIQTAAREQDTCARYGGEEFAVLALGLSPDEARATAERIRVLVTKAKLRRPGSDEQIAGLSVSVGATRLALEDDALSFIDRADRALYQAKGDGRNRVVTL